VVELKVDANLGLPHLEAGSMNSAVYYKFKSQNAESRIPIDGTGISVFDLKREIILANGLDKALDIDLQVFNQLGDEGVSCCFYTRCCS